ncbi:MAG: T9SS type A sorting domain-containing protein [Candidatus Marinimicrobia bacterium]|nr:T9SS type A sorting domain-containing protein [Candidatus Neomarinimicrobiota bacterium]
MIDVKNKCKIFFNWGVLFMAMDPTFLLSQDPPAEFQHEQSTLQGFYFFLEVKLDGSPIESDDWVATFNGDICVGARQWNPSNCGGGMCDVPAMGNDGADWTSGYMQSGNIPTFKIYDASSGNIYDAISSETVDPWVNNGFSMNDLLEANSEGSSDNFYFSVDLEDTGATQLTILSESITSLEVGDEIGIFDSNGIINYNNCDNDIGDLLVGAGIWDGIQLNIVSIGSVDMCAFGGVQVSGFVEGNPVSVKVWRDSEQMEYETQLAWELGSGNFGDIIQSISEITLIDPNACEDDDSAVSAFGGCVGAVAALGCDFVFGGIPIFESCPVTCDACPEVPILGCMDVFACNYNPEANEDSGCEYAEANFDCDGNCTEIVDCNGICNGSAIIDECGICDGPGSIFACGCEPFPEGDCDCDGNIEDCAGICNGDAEYDSCGVCGGDGSTCGDDGGWEDELDVLLSFGDLGGVVLTIVSYENASGTVCLDNAIVSDNSGYAVNVETGSCINLSDTAGELEIYILNSVAVGGFQFNVSGLTLISASGGAAANAGFMVSANGTTVIGFSLTGSSLDPLDDILGCTDGNACNYNSEAIQDDGSCEFAEDNFDCDGNCTETVDCYGICNGSAIIDECGVCGGDNSTCSDCAGIPNGDSLEDMCGACDNDTTNDCIQDCNGEWGGTAELDECEVCGGDNFTCSDCAGFPNGNAVVDMCGVCDTDSMNDCVQDCNGDWGGVAITDDCGECVSPDDDSCNVVPELFQFEQSTLQAFYFFNSVLDLQGNPIEPTDWVAAFKGDLCVGARQWNLDDCGGLCDVPVMGEDGEDWTTGYMVSGDLPSFKIYDSSEDIYFDAIPSQSNPWSNFGFLMADELNVAVFGCMDESAENYNSAATVDDGTCDFGLPLLFQFEQSTLQAFYFTYEAYDIYGESLEENDWVGAFNGDICVGARKWDLSLCQGGVCDIPVMGNDGSEQTQGYMQQGGIPTFKIYDASEGSYFAAVPSQNYAWSNFNMQFIDEIVATEIDYLSIPLHKDNNLVSFYILPSETSLISVMDDIQSNVLGVIGEAISSQYMVDEGGWVGSLTQFDTYSGYWIYMGDSVDTLDIEGVGIDPNKEYDLHEGLNLISFPVPGSVGISEGIPDEVEDLVPYIISEAVATAQINGEWVGSLDRFEGAHGYWFNVDEPFTFQYDLETLDVLSRQQPTYSSKVETPFEFSQSEVQSFYFIDIGVIEDAQFGDWILAYHNDVLVGSRQWMGKHIDVPVMGYDGKWNTIGYPQLGDNIEFKLYSESLKTELPLSVGIEQYIPNHVQIVESVSISLENIPTEFYLSAAYPNPFNPETMIKMNIPQTSNINVDVYDANGRHVDALISGTYKAGQYDITWMASEFPSGIYFITLSMQNEIHTTKVVLMK